MATTEDFTYITRIEVTPVEDFEDPKNSKTLKHFKMTFRGPPPLLYTHVRYDVL